MKSIVGRKVVEAWLSVRPGKVTAILIELDGNMILYGEMHLVRKYQGTCANCGELVPQGCCTCGPRRELA